MDVLRSGARRLLAQAIELEAEVFLAGMRDLTVADGRARLVRHRHGPERVIQTGIGPVPVTRVKTRDRGATATAERVRFSSSILPKFSRRQVLDAAMTQLQDHQAGGVGDSDPLVRTVLCRTVAKTLSMGLDARKWSQCSAGKS
jgi:hypothetical protein